MKKFIISFLVILAAANILMFAIPTAKKADVIISNTKIFDLLKIESESDAISFTDGKVSFIGKSTYVYPLIGDETKVLDNKHQAYAYPTKAKSIDEILKVISPEMKRDQIVKSLGIKETFYKDSQINIAVLNCDLEKKCPEKLKVIAFILDGKIVEKK